MGHVDVELAFPGLDPTTKARVERTFAALRQRGVSPIYVPDRRAALETALGLIPKGSTVAHGSSTTLQEIGLPDRLKDPASGHRYLNPEWQVQSDATRRAWIRAKLSVEADYYLGSVQAICETGEVIGADASGSRQAFYVYGPAHVIWVAGINKTRTELGPWSSTRTRGRAAARGSTNEAARRARELDRQTRDFRTRTARRITLVLVGEHLGF